MALDKKTGFHLPNYQFNYVFNAHYYRGLVINEFTGLEKTIEEYLTIHFIGDISKGRDLSNILIDRLTFESKRQAFKAIVDKKSIESGFIKTNSNGYPYNDLFKEIKELIIKRNYFAHYILVMKSEVNDSVLGLVEFRDRIDVKWYTEPDISTILDRIKEASKQVETLIKELK